MITKEYQEDFEKMQTFLHKRIEGLRKIDIQLGNDYDGPANIIRRMRPQAKPLRIEAKINDETLCGEFKNQGELKRFLKFVTGELNYNVVITLLPKNKIDNPGKEKWLLIFTKSKSKGLILTDEGIISINDLKLLTDYFNGKYEKK